jgi:hypothetical protein
VVNVVCVVGLLLAVVVVLLVIALSRSDWARENLLAPLITGTVGGLVVSVLVLVFGPNVAQNLAMRAPTCENPRGAVALRPEQQPTVSEEEHQPPAEGEVADWRVQNLVDRDTGSVWVPPDAYTLPESEHRPEVTFSFPQDVDLAAMCVVNGVPTSDIGYLRASRVRTVEVDAGQDDPRPTTLESVDESDIQDPQTVRIGDADTREVTLTIRETYSGRIVFDEERGEYLKPTGHTAIAEVYFLARDPDLPPLWQFWKSPD